MKNQLLNLKMIALMCLMMVLGGANVWAQVAQTIFLETFGANDIKKGSTKIANYSGYSATDVMFVTGNAKSNYSGVGSICRQTLSGDNVSSEYTDASGKSNCFYSTQKENVNKEVTIIKISNIKIEGYTKLQLSFGEAFTATSQNITVKSQIDGGEEKTLINGKPSNTKWLLKTLDIPSQGKSLTLTFVHKATKESHITRLDDIKVTGVKSAAEPTYTKQTPVTFRAEDNGDYYATFSNDKVTFITSDNSEAYKIVVSDGNIVKTKLDEVSADINGKTVKGFYIPANTGVLLYSIVKTADYYTVENKTVDAISPVDNMLEPAPKDGGYFAFNEGYKYYKLAYNDFSAKTGLGFYWGANDGGAFYVKGGTAYLKVLAADAAGAKGFAFNGEATGIDGVNANVENAKAIYNLNGQRVASMAKPGLYIVNGKKVVRK